MLRITIKFMVTCMNAHTEELKVLLNSLGIEYKEDLFTAHIPRYGGVPKTYFHCECDEQVLDYIKGELNKAPYDICLRYGDRFGL